MKLIIVQLYFTIIRRHLDKFYRLEYITFNIGALHTTYFRFISYIYGNCSLQTLTSSMYLRNNLKIKVYWGRGECSSIIARMILGVYTEWTHCCPSSLLTDWPVVVNGSERAENVRNQWKLGV